jgi:hypothetical protein
MFKLSYAPMGQIATVCNSYIKRVLIYRQQKNPYAQHTGLRFYKGLAGLFQRNSALAHCIAI